MDLLKKYEKLGIKYNDIFEKSVAGISEIEIESLNLLDFFFKTKKCRTLKTTVLRARYYREVSGRIFEEWGEAVKNQEKYIIELEHVYQPVIE